MQIEFTNPKFVSKTSQIRNFPDHELPEIAVIGRSNVGKSSLLNHFLKSPKLTVTSGTPGRTREYFFFNVQDKVMFVDLPGYGFAEISKSIKTRWASMLREYLCNRKQLKLVLLLQDIRRMPSEEDLEIIDLAMENDLAMILLFTKVDKLSVNERTVNRKRILDALGLDQCMHVFYSAHKNIGRGELSKHINHAFFDLLNPETPLEEESH